MDNVAAKLKFQIDHLAQAYAQRLQQINRYAEMPDSTRLDLARSTVEVLATCLASDDESGFIHFLQTRLAAPEFDSVAAEALLQALTALEETLMPLVDQAEAAKFLWRVSAQARTIISQRVIELLDESEQKFTAVTDKVAVGVFIHQDGLMRYMGREGARLMGYNNPAELLNRSILDFIAPEERSHVAEIASRRAAGDEVPTQYETRLLRKDGTIIDVLMYSMLIDYGGRIATQGTFIDITEQKQLEQQIRESLERRRRQVQTSTEVAQQIATTPRLDELFEQVVNSARNRFNYYHAHLYLLEEDKLVMRSGSGEAGRQMKEAGHQIPLMAVQSLVARAARSGETVLVSDVSQTPTWLPNPLLPDTKAEIAVPIKLGRPEVKAQIMALQRFIQRGFDGFFVAAIDPKAIAPVAKEALDNGLIVTAIHDLGDDNQTAFVGAEDYRSGYLLGLEAGRWAKTHLPEGELLKVAILNYPLLPQIIERERGYRAGIEQEYGHHFEVVTTQAAADTATALPIAQHWLQSYPDLHMILGINDATAIGAYQAAVAAGKNDPTRFFVGGVDAVPEALELIRAGTVYQATVDLPARLVGITIVRTMAAARVGQPYEKRFFVNHIPVTRANLDEFLAGRQSDEIEADTGLAKLELSGLRFGFSVMNLSNFFFESLVREAKAEADRLGIELVINDPRPVLGVLDIQSNEVGGLTEEDSLVLEGLAGQIAIAMENTRLLEDARIFRQFADTSAQGFEMASLAGLITYANSTLCQILDEAQSDEVLGKPILNYYSPEMQRRLLQEIIPTVMQRGRWSGETTLTSAKGRVVPALESYFLIRNDRGEPLYLADVVTDITERKRAEAELEERLRELNVLQQTMSREGWQAWRETESLPAGYHFDRVNVRPAEDLWLPALQAAAEQQRLISPSAEPNGQAAAAPLLVHNEPIGVLGVYDDPARPLTPEELALVEAVSEQVAQALEEARLFEQTQQASLMLQERVRELNCLNEVGREIEENPSIPDLLQWVTERIPPAMQYPDLCQVAIEFEGQIYGVAEAVNLPVQMAHGLYVSGDLLGRIHIAYTEKREFLDEESALLGGIATRVSSYIEKQRLLVEVQQRASELEETTGFLDSIVDNLPLMLFIKEAAELRFVRWNKAGLELLGRSREEMLGKNDYDFFPPAEAEFFIAKDRETLAKGELLEIPVEPIETADKGTRWLYTRKMPILGTDGKPKYLLGISVDITDRKQTEAERDRLLAEVQQSQQFLRTIIDNIPNPIFFKDVNGAYLGFNRAFLEYLGLPEEVLLGKTVYDLNTDKTLADKYHEKDMELFHNPGTQIYEARVKYADGSLRDVIFIKATFNNPAGDLGGLVGAMVDITERKQAEEAIRASQTQLAEALQIAQLAYWEFDVASQIFTFNDQLYAVYHTTVEEVGGYQVSAAEFAQKFVHPDDAANVGIQIQQALETTDPDYGTQFESKIIQGDGKEGYITVQLQIVKDEMGRTVKLYGINQNITERKQAELERERLLAEVEATYRQYIQQEWSQFLTEQHGGRWQIELKQPGLAAEPDDNGHNKATIEALIALRGQQLGRLSLEDVNPNRRWTAEEKALVEAVSEQLAQTVENLRLFDETRQRATREQLTRQITDKMRAAPDVDSIIETGLTELAKALGAARTYVKLAPKLEQPVQVGPPPLKQNGHQEVAVATSTRGQDQQNPAEVEE